MSESEKHVCDPENNEDCADHVFYMDPANQRPGARPMRRPGANRRAYRIRQEQRRQRGKR